MALPALNGNTYVDDAVGDELASARIFIALTPSLLKAIEDHFYSQRFPSKSAAARDLLEAGIEMKRGLKIAPWRGKNLT